MSYKPQCDTKIEGLKLPEMKELDEIKESSKNTPPSQTADSHISAKYELFKEILGNPKNGEQSCSDRQGKYRLYENGAIFWHPEIGSYEVHVWKEANLDILHLMKSMFRKAIDVTLSRKVESFSFQQRIRYS